MFQLIYLRFTQPRADPAMFGVITSQTKVALANQDAQPGSRSAKRSLGAHAESSARARR